MADAPGPRTRQQIDMGVGDVLQKGTVGGRNRSSNVVAPCDDYLTRLSMTKEERLEAQALHREQKRHDKELRKQKKILQAAEQQLKREQLMPMGETASVSGGGVEAKREACEKAALARKDGAPPERYVSLFALSLYMRAIASASLVYYISTYRCRCRCRCPAC